MDLPRGDHEFDLQPGHPCWFSMVGQDSKARKPIIRCNCGKLIGLRLHHVHADGRVTASFFHAREEQLQRDAGGFYFIHKGTKYYTEPGCGWHEWLRLLDYSAGEFPSET